jgi:hypothetical protein
LRLCERRRAEHRRSDEKELSQHGSSRSDLRRENSLAAYCEPSIATDYSHDSTGLSTSHSRATALCRRRSYW